MRIKITLANFIIFLWVIAIGFIGCSHMLTKKQPSKEDIVGNWIPDGKTIEYLKSEGKYQDYHKIKLIFKESGDFEAILPDWYFSLDGKSLSTVRSISGKWEIWSTDNRVWSILLSYDATSMLDVRWDGSRFILYSYIGDADNNDTMDFIKLK